MPSLIAEEASDPTKQIRNWIFVLNNYTKEDVDHIRKLSVNDGIVFLTYQPERGENTGTPHLQGVVCFKNGRRREGVKRLFRSTTIHVEPMRGSIDQNLEYAGKEKTRDTEAIAAGIEAYTYGEAPRNAGNKGGRSDLAEVADAVRAGKSGRELFELAPTTYLRNYKGIEFAAQFYQGKRQWKTEVHWYYGPTGSGKSRKAFEENEGAYWKNCHNEWWDGYTGQSCVILDDYRKDFCKFSQLLNLFDRYPFRVNIKGTTREFVARKIVVTAPKSWRDMWSGRTEEDLEQLGRRITVCIKFPIAEGDQGLNEQEVGYQADPMFVRLGPPPKRTKTVDLDDVICLSDDEDLNF